jgi:hypothetical protein
MELLRHERGGSLLPPSVECWHLIGNVDQRHAVEHVVNWRKLNPNWQRSNADPK